MADNTTAVDAHGDTVHHGIDGSPDHDAEKGAVGGAVGGAVVGGLAGGPVGAVIGAVVGGAASGVGVAAVDRVDNDNTVSGLGHGEATTGGSAQTGTHVTGDPDNVTRDGDTIIVDRRTE